VTDPKHHAIEADIWGSDKGPEALGKANHVLSRSIVIDGLIAGFWEVNPRAAGAVWHTFDPAPRPLARELDERTADTARFLLDEIGHAKVFSLDTMDDVQMRADRIVNLAGGKPAARPGAGKAAGGKSAGTKATGPARATAKPAAKSRR
jgi:hypothetical protein